jgi:hypothetical protein
VQVPSWNSPADYNLFVWMQSVLQKSVAGWEIVIYDRTGVVELSACKLEAIELNPLLAEALGARWCFQASINIKFQRVTISSDAATVFKCLNYNLCNSARLQLIQ